ncbi:MAG: hypothetical protein GX234_06445 [Clostridiales bacterium]|nr:hypothetical protein [Clostridiales bacterium]
MMLAGRTKKGRPALSGVLALAVTAVLCILTAFGADYYYALNDDVLMKDILAGVLTGTPTGYNIQMLYPISVFIAFFYRIFPTLPWYGLFLCLCQWGSLFLIIQRCLVLWEKRSRHLSDPVNLPVSPANFPAYPEARKSRILVRGLILAGAGIAAISLLWQELVYVQYTVTCTMLAATGIFLLYTNPASERMGDFLKKNLPAMLLLVFAFLIRTEMLLLLLPFLGAAGLIRLVKEPHAIKKYSILVVLMIAGMAVCYGADRMAYGSTEWQEFRRFFDARTEVYDFYGIPPYEGNEAFYESIGMSAEEWMLLDNYNFGLDETLNADKMERIAEYAGRYYYEAHPWQERIRAAVWEYAHRMFPLPGDTIGAFRQDMPWNITILFLYGTIILMGIVYRRKGIFLEIPLLFAARTVSWGYVLFRGRVPERISHSLYLAEALTLFALLCVWHGQKSVELTEGTVLREQESRQAILRSREKRQRIMRGVCCILPGCLMVFLIGNVPVTVKKVWLEQEKRMQENKPNEELKAFCRENAEHYYYVDVRSTVYFSEKMFEKVDNLKRNYDIIGGWACKSPICSTEEIRFFVTEKGKDISWFHELLTKQQKQVKLIPTKDHMEMWDVYCLEGRETE